MLKDVTLGQYFPGETAVHKMDPRTKLVLVIVYIVALFLATLTHNVVYQHIIYFSAKRMPGFLLHINISLIDSKL